MGGMSNKFFYSNSEIIEVSKGLHKVCSSVGLVKIGNTIQVLRLSFHIIKVNDVVTRVLSWNKKFHILNWNMFKSLEYPYRPSW